jgi:DNA-binding HxlR family transcriptional regulator
MNLADKDNSIDHNETLKWHCVKHKNDEGCENNCYFQKILSLFGKKNTLPLIRLLLKNKVLRFNEILNQIGGSPKTLTERLRELEFHGLIKREVFNEIPIKVEYSLTAPGKDLDTLFDGITIWIEKWFLHDRQKKEINP